MEGGGRRCVCVHGWMMCLCVWVDDIYMGVSGEEVHVCVWVHRCVYGFIGVWALCYYL